MASLATLAERRLRFVMTPNPVTLDREATLDQALELFDCYGFRHLPVVECNRVLGMVSDRDLRLATGLLSSASRKAGGVEQGLVGPERVHEVMRHPVHNLSEEARVADAAQCMLRHAIGAVPVVQDECLIGIVTETDLLRTFVELRGEARSDRPAREHLTGPLTWVAPDTSLEKALGHLDPSRHLGVVDGGHLVGLVSERDLTRGIARATISAARARSAGRLPGAPPRVRDVMATRLVTANPETPLWHCAARMLDHKVSALPVLAGERALGILAQREVLGLLAMGSVEDQQGCKEHGCGA